MAPLRRDEERSDEHFGRVEEHARQEHRPDGPAAARHQRAASERAQLRTGRAVEGGDLPLGPICLFHEELVLLAASFEADRPVSTHLVLLSGRERVVQALVESPGACDAHATW